MRIGCQSQSSQDSDAPDHLGNPSGSVSHTVDPYDDRSAEFMDLLAMLYFVIEVSRTDETFGDELSKFLHKLDWCLR
jgi:hypothetical protein